MKPYLIACGVPFVAVARAMENDFSGHRGQLELTDGVARGQSDPCFPGTNPNLPSAVLGQRRRGSGSRERPTAVAGPGFTRMNPQPPLRGLSGAESGKEQTGDALDGLAADGQRGGLSLTRHQSRLSAKRQPVEIGNRPACTTAISL
ncbi:hypothetical protein AAFF_G00304850 [Aldrovandia affinis]|uniref:Uncharacterized protein n=1 Tax=Aldrovandia affinis TaxID=143900 RepID=A0AAD7SP30_9TELE|nr:hypothetical protein AAFF_G00304850 [Aldrovandia affinis]